MEIKEFIKKLENNGIILNEEQINQFDIYYQTLVEWNKKLNLTAITEKRDVYLKHFYDSISVAFHFDFKKELKICDVGAGAGFPSIPLKICFPHLSITIVDSLKKRIDFLSYLGDKLNLDDVYFYHSRAEDFGNNKEHREVYDVVMARAVARLSVLSELCIPLVALNGMFIAMKGSQASDELNNAKKAIYVLGGVVSEQKTFKLPKEKSERSIIMINKTKKTPNKYPRKAGTPNKKPIK